MKELCIDERKIRDKITNRTKAIICVDIFGLFNMDEILRISKNIILKPYLIVHNPHWLSISQNMLHLQILVAIVLIVTNIFNVVKEVF